MDIRFEIDDTKITAWWGNSSATVDITNVIFAHLGCKLLGTLPNIPSNIRQQWNTEFSGLGWANKLDSRFKLAHSLEKAICIANMDGAVLWDTMRSGSDYWRPGKLLSEAIEMLSEDYRQKITFSREDALCPPRNLLTKFMNDESMSFGSYGMEYSEYLNSGNILSMAMASVIFDLSRKKLPVFYCVDPYIPHFANKEECCTTIPYDQRHWLNELRTDGCHRVILIEEIAKEFFKYNIDVKIVELNPTFQESYVKSYSGQQFKK